MAEWSLLVSQPTPPQGSEQWASLSIPGSPSHLAYGFRVLVPEGMPQSWNTMGYFGVFAAIGDRYIIGPTRPIVAIGRGALQSLQLLNANDSLFPPVPIGVFGIGYYVNSWIDATTAEVWVLQ